MTLFDLLFITVRRTVCAELLLPLYGHYTGQPVLAGIPS